jgi:hypothetical protein
MQLVCSNSEMSITWLVGMSENEQEREYDSA